MTGGKNWKILESTGRGCMEVAVEFDFDLGLYERKRECKRKTMSDYSMK